MGRAGSNYRWDLIGLGALVVGLLVFLFGDNIVGRIWSPDARPVPPRTEPIEANGSLDAAQENIAASAPAPPSSSAVTGPRLIDQICGARALAVTFATRGSDPRRYRRRAGTTIVPISSCNPEFSEFRTGDGFSDRGIVSGSRIEFQYYYTDDEGAPTCRVRASVTSRGRLEGTIFCEAVGSTLENRPATVEIE